MESWAKSSRAPLPDHGKSVLNPCALVALFPSRMAMFFLQRLIGFFHFYFRKESMLQPVGASLLAIGGGLRASSLLSSPLI